MSESEEDNKPILQPSTIKAYNGKLKKLNKENINYNDIDDVIKRIYDTDDKKELNLSTVKGYLSAVLWYIKNNNIDAKQKLYLAKIYELNKTITKERGTNKLTETEKDKYISLGELKALKDIIFIKVKQDNYKDYFLHKFYVVLCLYIDIPPRRLQDYTEMVYYKRKPLNSSINENYLILSDVAGYFIYNVYKTAKIYDQQIFTIPKPLQETLRTFITKQNINIGDSLLNCSVSALNDFITSNMFKYTGKNASINIFRHSYTTMINEKGKNYSLNTRKRIANKMGHGVIQQLEYSKHK